MIGRIVKLVLRPTGAITAGLLLVLASLAVLPAVPASAASQVESWWGTTSNYKTYFGTCTAAGWQVQQGVFPVLEVYNPCSDRVWVHYVNLGAGTVQSYCVNPGGGLAYAIPNFPFSSSETYRTSSSPPTLIHVPVAGTFASTGKIPMGR